MSFSVPKMHKAALLRKYGERLSIESVPTPQPAGESVLIKTVGSGICHTDVCIWKGDWVNIGIPPRIPFILSHEISGIIVARGENVPAEWKEGQKVLIYAFYWEGEDNYTIRGLTNLAERPKHLGIMENGGLQEYVYIPHYKLLVNADDLEDLAAASTLCCAGITTYRAVRTAMNYLVPDDYVAVVGLGGLGAYAVQWVKGLIPYVNLIGIDVREEALEFASKIAVIDAVINASRENEKAISETTKGKGVKVIVDTVGSDQTIKTYINTLMKGGAYIIVGLMGTNLHIPIYPFVTGERHLIGSFIGTLAQQREVVELARKGLINYKKVVTKRYQLENINEAIKELEEKRVLGRQIITYQ